MANEYLAHQLSGNLAQGVIDSIQAEYQKNDNALSYYLNLSINTAALNDLESIGLWIGMPWPTAPKAIIDGTAFIFDHTPSSYNPTIGFGSTGSSFGGTWVSLTPSDIQRIPADKYRALLKWYAAFKRNGFTVASIDEVAHIFGDNYEINYVKENIFALAPGLTPENNPKLGLAPADLSSGGHFASGASWDINLVFTTNIGGGNVWALQYVFDQICDVQRVNVSQALF